MKKYQVFKAFYLKHIGIRRKQMIERYQNKDEQQLRAHFILLKEYGFNVEKNKQMILGICRQIYHSKRIVLIGSDEMIGHSLRMQGDFCVMNKFTVKDSVFKNNYFNPKPDDYIILLSMNGKVLDLNPFLKENLLKCQSNILTIGQFNSLETTYLSIPRNVDEVIENMILDYYLQEITYTYMREFYDN